MSFAVGDCVKPTYKSMVDVVLGRVIGTRGGIIVKQSSPNQSCFVVKWLIDGKFQVGGDWHKANLSHQPPLEALAMMSE